MAVNFQVVIVGISILYLPSLASPTNWFYDAPRALFGLAGLASASASSSSAVTPGSYIADLRQSDIKRRQEKFEQLQNEKDLTKQAELLDANDGKEDNNGNEEGENEGTNEAAPSFLEKKIGKILTKLRLIAQIKNAYHYNPEVHEHESNITFNITSGNHTPNVTNDIQKDDINEDIDIDPRFVNTQNQSENTEPKSPIRIAKIQNHSENIEANQQNQEPVPVYGVPKEPILIRNKEKLLENEPLRIQLDVNHINNNLENFDVPKNEKLKEQEPGKFGTLGIFFAELLGSVVGLAYGALAQITSGGQSPVTISTSEGL